MRNNNCYFSFDFHVRKKNHVIILSLDAAAQSLFSAKFHGHSHATSIY